MLALIQSRLNSKRLKGKALIDIYGHTLIEHVYFRVKKSKFISKIIVCISNRKTDNKLARFLKSKKILFFRGDLNNVTKRLLDAAKKNKSKYFIRISGDSPLINSKILDDLIVLFKKNKNKQDLVTNVFPRTFPSGQSGEIIKVKLLEKNIIFFKSCEKEHVTKYFYKNSDQFKIKNMINNKKIYKNKKKLSVDTNSDLNFLKKKYRAKFLEL